MSLTVKEVADIEATSLEDIGGVAVDDVIEYVHTIDKVLPKPLELYAKYLKNRWNVYDLDFTQDKIDWEQNMTEAERSAFIGVASGFHHGERQVEVELPAFFLSCEEDEKIFATCHMEDEARHTVFFDRFYREVVGIPGETLMDVLDASWQWVGDGFGGAFGLLSYQADELLRDPKNKQAKMAYAANYFVFIEGVGALSVMKITLNYARQRGFLPGYYKGFTATCRDEARHVQFGLSVIRKMLDEDPTLVGELFETIRTVLYAFGTNSQVLYLEPIGFSEEMLQAMFVNQLNRKLELIGVELPPDLKALTESMDAVLIGG